MTRLTTVTKRYFISKVVSLLCWLGRKTPRRIFMNVQNIPRRIYIDYIIVVDAMSESKGTYGYVTTCQDSQWVMKCTLEIFSRLYATSKKNYTQDYSSASFTRNIKCFRKLSKLISLIKLISLFIVMMRDGDV